MGCDDQFYDPLRDREQKRTAQLWRLKRRFEAASVMMDKFTLSESLILHRALLSDRVESRECTDEELQQLLAVERRIFGDNG